MFSVKFNPQKKQLQINVTAFIILRFDVYFTVNRFVKECPPIET